jgi:hypothetical protein
VVAILPSIVRKAAESDPETRVRLVLTTKNASHLGENLGSS